MFFINLFFSKSLSSFKKVYMITGTITGKKINQIRGGIEMDGHKSDLGFQLFKHENRKSALFHQQVFCSELVV